MRIEKLTEIIDAAYSKEEYPVLKYQSDKWCNKKPLDGIKILDATPVFRNTIAKYIPLILAGAELCVGISDIMPYDKNILKILSKAGVRVVRPDSDEEFDIVLDCAASFVGLNARIGYVELTRSGVEKYASSSKPVFVADSGRIKRIETSLGTGESYFRALEYLGYNNPQKSKLVIFGSGKVGSGIIYYAQKRGLETVVITDTKTSDIAGAIDFRDKASIKKAIVGAYAVVTATGVYSAVEKCGVADEINNSNAILANMGVEDEFGATIPAERVLNAKAPLNFILDEPTHLKYIDATMALHNEGAVFLATFPQLNGIILPSEETERELLEISKNNGIIRKEIESIW